MGGSQEFKYGQSKDYAKIQVDCCVYRKLEGECEKRGDGIECVEMEEIARSGIPVYV